MPNRSRALEAFALLVVFASLFSALSRTALWDPVELETAELARRIAVFLSADPALGDAAHDPVPTRGELGRGELPFVAIALGFRLFGLAPWAGRLPLALFALAGIAATYFLLRRLASPRAAALSALVLATSPLYFLHARTLLGDITTMSANAIAVCGFALYVFDADRRVRALGACLAGAAVFLGFYSRGPLLGVAPAALAVGLSFLALELAGASQLRVVRRAGGSVLGFGLASALAGWVALAQTPSGTYSLWVGSSLGAHAAASFEAGVRELLHAMFPWSALLLPALALTFGNFSRLEPERAALSLISLSALLSAICLQAALSPSIGAVPFVLPSAVATLLGLALDELDRKGLPAPLFTAATLLVALLLLRDFHALPDKLLTAIAAPAGTLSADKPLPGFANFMFGAVATFAVSSALLFGAPARARVFRGFEYALRFRWATTLYEGRLWYGVVAAGAAGLGLDLALSLGASGAALSGLRGVARAGWIGLALSCLLPVLALLVRDLSRVATAPGALLSRLPRLARFRGLRFGRAASAAVLLSILGLATSAVFYPRLVASVSPDPVLGAHARHARSGEPLAVFGQGLRGVRYNADRNLVLLSDREQAARYVEDGVRSGARRFLALPRTELAPLNALIRARSSPRRNLPIVDPETHDFVLAASVLGPGEYDFGPFEDFFRTTPPAPENAVTATLGGSLELTGFSIRSLDRRRASTLIAGESYDLVLYFHVLAPLDEAWRVFVHLDGFQQRFNADHEPLDGQYPTTLWLSGDHVIDRYRMRVDASLAPATYSLYAGMHRGDVRLAVTRGASDDDRIFLGALRVD